MKDCIVLVNRAYTRQYALVSVKWIKGFIWLCYAKGGRYKLINDYFSKEEIEKLETIELLPEIMALHLQGV